MNVTAISLSPRSRQLLYLRDLLRELVRRDLKVQYKNSILGVAWSLLNPLLQLLVFTFLFRVVMPLGIPNYGTFAFAGLLAWSWFQLSLMQATGAISAHRELIRRPRFPVVILPAITVTTNLINLLLALPLLLIFILASGGHISFSLLGLPVVMAMQFMLVLGFAYLLATANVLFRDTQHLVGFCLQLLFWMTPVFYLASKVPGKYQAIYRLNPMLHIVESYRDVLIYGRLPEFGTFAVLCVTSMGALAFGYAVFNQMRDRFVEEL